MGSTAKNVAPLQKCTNYLLLGIFQRLSTRTIMQMRKTCPFMDNFVEGFRKDIYASCKDSHYVITLNFMIKQSEVQISVETLNEETGKHERFFKKSFYLNKNVSEREFLSIPFRNICVAIDDSLKKNDLGIDGEKVVLNALKKLQLCAPAFIFYNLPHELIQEILKIINGKKEIILQNPKSEDRNSLPLENSKSSFTLRISDGIGNDKLSDFLQNSTNYEILEFKYLIYYGDSMQFLLNELQTKDLGKIRELRLRMAGHRTFTDMEQDTIIFDMKDFDVFERGNQKIKNILKTKKSLKKEEDELLEEKKKVASKIARLPGELKNNWIFVIVDYIDEAQYWEDCKCKIVMTKKDESVQQKLIEGCFSKSQFFGKKYETFLKAKPEQQKKSMFHLTLQ